MKARPESANVETAKMKGRKRQMNVIEVNLNDDELPLREYSKRDKMRRIREATEKLLVDKPISEITMKDVARVARIGEATLFRYVGAKEELLLLVFGARMEAFVEEIEASDTFLPRPGMSGDEVVELICELYRRRSAVYLADPENVTDYVRVGFEPGNGVGELSVALGDRTRTVVERLLRHGQDTGVIRNDWDAATIAVNCAGHYLHEILRSPARGYEPGSFAGRLESRLRVQLEPLIVSLS
ncbi:TetR/AcrR family transcriptional regulator [Mycetocola sp. 2940]|uniref:TetR/AcrR family transcriptional regulator n=1 Tax=Mycetocola sp. 2940 TaxID=3156452 RepID=UPI00339662DA